MTQISPDPTVVRAYADGVRGLLEPAIVLPAERQVRGRRDLNALAEQAAALAPLSAGATDAIAGRLSAAEPAERSQATTQLLAKALTDLQVGALLLQAAAEEEAGESPEPAPRAAGIAEEALSVTHGELDAWLAILAGEDPAMRASRAIVIPADLPSARSQLGGLITATLKLVQARAAKTGQTALSGLLALGLGKVAEAAGLVGLDIAQALGVAEKVTRLYVLAREYFLNAYNAVVAVFGPAIVQSAVQQALAWLNDVAAGQQFERLLEQLYATSQTDAQLAQLVAESQADLGRFVSALQGVDGLATSFQEQIGLVDRLLQGFRLFGGAAVVAIPQVTVLLAAAYLSLVAFAILSGAEYVDAARLKFLNRVPGVRQVVEANLLVSQ